MNARRLSFYPLFVLLTVSILMLSACQTAATATIQPTAQSTAAPQIPATQTSLPTEPTSPAQSGITVDYSSVAQNGILETVNNQPASAPYLETAPQYRRLTLQGYPVANDMYQPQIFIYAVSDLSAANENAAKAAANLQTLLQNKQPGDQLPFLPLIFSAKQALDVQVQYLDFKSGTGVRYLTQFNNGMSPINNARLLYTFQGLTRDGKYYVAVVLPVTHPELPDNSDAGAVEDYPGYIAQTTTLLNQQPPATFTPDLNKLDALISSIEIQ